MSLRHGSFQFKQTDDNGSVTGDFVFVPKEYKFTRRKSVEEIFNALNLKSPEFIFNFLANHGIMSRSDEKKTIKEWYQEALQEEEPKEIQEDMNMDLVHEEALQEAETKEIQQDMNIDLVEKRKQKDMRDLRARKVLSSIPTEGSLFLINKPYGGNVFSRIAVEAANEKGIASLALLTCDNDGIDSHRITYLKGEEKDSKLNEQGRDVRREYIDCEKFEDLNCCVPIGDTPEESIDAMADYSKIEMEFYSKYSVEQMKVRPFIPGLLADLCSHRLVFEKQETLNIFRKELEDFTWCAAFAAGNSLPELRALKCALQYGKPVIVFHDSGPISDIALEFEVARKENAVNEIILELKEVKKLNRDGALISHLEAKLRKEVKAFITFLESLKNERFYTKSKDFKSSLVALLNDKEKDHKDSEKDEDPCTNLEVHAFYSKEDARNALKGPWKDFELVKNNDDSTDEKQGNNFSSKELCDEVRVATQMCSNLLSLGTDNLDNLCVIEIDSSCCYTSREQIMKLMSTDYSNDEVDGLHDDDEAIFYGRDMQQKLTATYKRYYYTGLFIALLILSLTLASVFLTSARPMAIEVEVIPSMAPSSEPSLLPSASPSSAPSSLPSASPSSAPSLSPTQSVSPSSSPFQISPGEVASDISGDSGGVASDISSNSGGVASDTLGDSGGVTSFDNGTTEKFAAIEPIMYIKLRTFYWLVTMMTFALAVARSLDIFLVPFTKHSKFRLAKHKLLGEEYRFRTRTGRYKPHYARGFNNNGIARREYIDQIKQIYRDCMETEASEGYIENCLTWSRISQGLRHVGKGFICIFLYLRCLFSLGYWHPQFRCCERKSSKNHMERNAQMDYYQKMRLDAQLQKTTSKDDYGQLSLEQYVKKRVIHERQVMSRKSSRYAFFRNVCLCLVVVGTAITPVLSAKIWRVTKDQKERDKEADDLQSQAKFVPFTLAIVAAIKTIMQLFQMNTAVANYNDVMTELTNAELRFMSLGEAKCLREHKEDIVDCTEKALLDRVKYTVSKIEIVSSNKASNVTSGMRKALKSMMNKKDTLRTWKSKKNKFE